MDMVLQGISRVACHIDNILISTKDEWQHLATLEEVFKRLEKNGFQLKQDKCVFLTPSVEYVDRFIDQEGIHPLLAR